jgi:hypothetical protein
MDHSRDPCPWVILNDFGGAFAMGVRAHASELSALANSTSGCWWCCMARCEGCTYKVLGSSSTVLTSFLSSATPPTANDASAPSQPLRRAHRFSAATSVSGEDFSTHTTAQSRAYERRRTHGTPSSQDSSPVVRSQYEEAISRCAMARYRAPSFLPLSKVSQLDSTA